MAYVGLHLLSPSYTIYASNLNYLYINHILPEVYPLTLILLYSVVSDFYPKGVCFKSMPNGDNLFT